MTSELRPPDGRLDLPSLVGALVCFTLWGVFPLLFHALGEAGVGAWEIVGYRIVFAAPVALALVVGVGKTGAALAIFRQPRQLLALAASSAFISLNWSVYVWAIGAHHTLSASVGYFLNPLMNAAVGALIFRERISRLGVIAFAVAAIGVAFEASVAGDAPWTPLVLATSFCVYGLIRRQTTADATTGLLIECLIMAPFAAALLIFLSQHGGLRFGTSTPVNWMLLIAGPATVAPLALFSFAARRLPLTVIGFLQFLSPSLQFVCGLVMGETLHPLTLAAFSFIWIGAAIYAVDLARRLRRESLAETDAATSQNRA